MKRSAIASLPPYAHDACDKKQLNETIESTEYPRVRQAMRPMQIE